MTTRGLKTPVSAITPYDRFADAHLLGLHKLLATACQHVFNLGNVIGDSVAARASREVVSLFIYANLNAAAMQRFCRTIRVALTL